MRNYQANTLRRVLVIPLVLAMLVGVAWAFWSATTTAGSNGGAAATTLNAGATPTALVSGGADVTISWPATTLTSGQAVTGYQIKRYNASNQSQTMLSACAVTITALTCTESSVPSGTWTYTVTPRFATHWVGVESAKSNAVATSTASDVTGPTGGSVAASGLGGTGNAYSTSTTLSLTLVKGTDPSGVAATGARLMRATATYTGTGGGSGTCGTFGIYTQVGANDPASPKSDTVADEACYRYQYVVADSLGNETTYTSIDIRVDTTPNGAYWEFNEGTGTTAVDSSGNGNTATLQAGASWTTGKVGSNALSLNGATNSFASSPNPVIDTSESYTVAGWVKYNALTGNHNIATIEGAGNVPFFLKRDAGGSFQFAQTSVDSTGPVWAWVNGLVPVVGTWYHVAGVYNKGAATIELFVNGVSQGTSAATPTTWKALGSTVIGRAKWAGVSDFYTNGTIDEVRFFSSALTGTQISTLAGDVTGPTGGSVTAIGLGGTGNAYSTSTTLSLTLVKGTDPSGVAATGARLMRATATYTGTGNGSGTCGSFGTYVQVGANDPASPRSDTVADEACYRYQYVVADTKGNETTYTSIDIKVDTSPNGATWAFNEGTGTTAADGTGNGNTATLQAGASWTTGKVGSNALSLNGTATSSASTPYPVIDTSQSYTVAGWVKYNVVGVNPTVASIDGTNVGAFFLKKNSGGTFQFALPSSDSTTPASWTVVNGPTPVAGTWYHLAGVYNRTAGTIQLYVNGVSQGTAIAPQPWKALGSTAIGRARWDGISDNFTNGTIDEVRFYSSVLTGTQIAALADSTGPTGGSITATGLGGVGNAYSTSTTLNLTLVKGTDPSGMATTGARLLRATATYTGTGGGTGTCGTFGSYTQVGADDPTSPTSDTVADAACYRYRYVVADTTGNETTYTSIDIKVDTTPNGAYWTFNEGTGTAAADSSGNGNTATLASQAGWTTGKYGSALNLTGASTSIASRPNPVIDTSQSYTVAGWVRYNAFNGNSNIASIEGTSIVPFFLKRDQAGKFQFAQTGSDSTTPAWAFVNSSASPVVNTWYHLAGVYDKTAGTVALFVNGVSQGTATSIPAPWKALGATVIGRSKWNGVSDSFSNGAIDDLRFYSSALSPAEVAALASDTTGPAGGSVSATGLVGTGDRYTTSTTINLSLAKGTDASGLAASGHVLHRATGTLTNGACGTYGTYALVATDPAATFSDVVTGGACYAYRYIVLDSLGQSTTYASGDIKVDSTVPSTPTLALTASANTSVTGSTVYYRSAAASGSFGVTASATDAQSGIAGFAFPGLGANWTSTPGAMGVNTYSWSGTPAAPGTKNVTATNHATGTSANAPFTATADDAAPSAGSVTYSDTTQTSTTISVGFTTGTDSGSGVDTRRLMRASATLSGTTCDTFGSFSTITGGTNPAGSPVVDTVTSGRCYKYQYEVTDKVGNQDTAMSASIVKVSAATTCGSGQLIANPGFESGDEGAWTTGSGGMIGQDQVPANTGTWKVWLGGYGTDSNDTVTQRVTLPASCTVSLSYYLRVTTVENSGPSDYLHVQVLANGGTTTVQTFSDRDFGSGYVQRFVDLSAYAGQTITLRFLSDENEGAGTNFFVDDVSLTTSAGVVASYSQTISGTAGLVDWFRLGDTGSTDTFAGSTGATLQSRAGEVGATWTKHSGVDAVITAGARVRKLGDLSGASNYYTSVTPASPDYTVKADVFVASAVANDVIGVVGRVNPANGTYYLARYEASNSSWTLFSVVNDSWVWLGGYYQPLTAGASYNLSLDLDGSTIRLLVDGVERVSVVNSAITAAGRGGVAFGGSGSGTTITNTTGMHLDNFSIVPDATDSFGVNHGDILNGVTLGIAGAIAGNTAVSFDGVDDYVSVARHIQDDFSIEFWFKSTQGTGAGTQWWSGAGMVDAEVYGAGNDFGVSLLANGSVVAGVGAPDVSIASPAGYNNGAWHHVVFTRAMGTGTLHLYVDGASAGTVTGTTSSSLTGPPTITFGRQQAGSNYYAGSLDEVALYNVVLTQAQVSAHYSAR